MRIGLGINYAGGFKEVAAEVADLERAGLDIVFVPEAYSYDAVSALGYLAASTERVELASGILQLYTRTPTLTAMTAAGLDYVSDGRFTLGLGASGPQVIEGFHGVRYDAPIARTREVIEICRQVWRREKLQYQGEYYEIPLPAGKGTGLGKSLKLINKPVRERIPILIAALGPKNVELAAELAEGWQPIFFLPEKAQDVWGEALAAGKANRDPALGDLEVFAGPTLAIGENIEPLREIVKPHLALYIGGMGAKGKNFYHTLATSYGYGPQADRIQELYLAGDKEAAAKAVPDELVRDVSLIGTPGFVKERVAAFREAGVTTLNVVPIAGTAAERVKLIETLRGLVD
jgi:F420-dependent oxidoreductase-like protein